MHTGSTLITSEWMAYISITQNILCKNRKPFFSPISNHLILWHSSFFFKKKILDRERIQMHCVWQVCVIPVEFSDLTYSYDKMPIVILPLVTKKTPCKQLELKDIVWNSFYHCMTLSKN